MAMELTNSALASSWGSQYLFSLLAYWDDSVIFSQKKPTDTQGVIAAINSRLNSQNKKLEGLLLLQKFVAQCSQDTFTDSGTSWILQAVKATETQFGTELQQTAFQVLYELLKRATKFPELTKTVASNVVPQLVERLGSSSDPITIPALRCIEICMKNYGGSCIAAKGSIERKLLEYATSQDWAVVCAAADCVSVLAQVGGGGTEQRGHRAAWTQLLEKLLVTIHIQLDQIFENIREVYSNYNDLSVSLSLPAIKENNPVLTVDLLKTRIINLCRYVYAMLVNPFPVAKGVLPKDVLGLVCRGLATTSRSLGKKSTTEVLALSAALPSLHIAMLSVLDALVACCRTNLLPYGRMIIQLPVQTLKWTQTEKPEYAMERPYGKLRVAAYQSLCLWLQETQASSGIDEVADQLLPLVLQDVIPERDTLALQLQIQTPKKSTPSRKRKSQQAVNVRSVTGNVSLENVNKATCLAALKTLEMTLYAGGCLLKASYHKALQEFAVPLLFDLQRGVDPPLPYGDVSCYVQLLSLLQALVLEPNSQLPPPLHLAFIIFSAGQSSTKSQVAAFCKGAVRVTERLVHPMYPSLEYPPVPAEVEPKTLSISTLLTTNNEDVEMTDSEEDELPPLRMEDSEDNSRSENNKDSDSSDDVNKLECEMVENGDVSEAVNVSVNVDDIASTKSSSTIPTATTHVEEFTITDNDSNSSYGIGETVCISDDDLQVIATLPNSSVIKRSDRVNNPVVVDSSNPSEEKLPSTTCEDKEVQDVMLEEQVEEVEEVELQTEEVELQTEEVELQTEEVEAISASKDIMNDKEAAEVNEMLESFIDVDAD